MNASALEEALRLPAKSVWCTRTDLAPSPVSVKLLPLPLTQLVPPLVLYCQAAPASRPVTLTVPLLVMPSPGVPLSSARLRPGAATTVSRVTDSMLDIALWLPATSVWRTVTLVAPSPVSVKLLPLPATQLVPPLLLYCHVAPASKPLTLTVPLLVMRSVAELPLSLARATLGAATAESSVKASALDARLTLPAASVWRTMTVLAPSPLSVKLLPLPASQLVPPLMLYCQVAPASRPATLTLPLLVMPSPTVPLSSARLRLGATGAVVSAGGATVVSSVKASALDARLTLPAASVWRTMTVLAPSPLSVKLLPLPASQLVPPLMLYCQVAPASRPATLTLPLLVMPSPTVPLSSARLRLGATGAVVSTGGVTVLSMVRLSAFDATPLLPAPSL